VDIEVFLKDILIVCTSSKIVKGVEVVNLDNVVLKVRIHLTANLFINVFYNAETRRTAFALIKDNKRIFGADNTGRWHLHPYDNPEEHKLCKEISFKQFFDEVEKIFKKLE